MCMENLVKKDNSFGCILDKHLPICMSNIHGILLSGLVGFFNEILDKIQKIVYNVIASELESRHQSLFFHYNVASL